MFEALEIANKTCSVDRGALLAALSLGRAPHPPPRLYSRGPFMGDVTVQTSYQEATADRGRRNHATIRWKLGPRQN